MVDRLPGGCGRAKQSCNNLNETITEGKCGDDKDMIGECAMVVGVEGE